MGAEREAELEAANEALRRENLRLTIQARRLVDELNDAEENTRVYRRFAYNTVEKCGRCPLCNPSKVNRN